MKYIKEITMAGCVSFFFIIVAHFLGETPSLFEGLIAYLVLANYFTMTKEGE